MLTNDEELAAQIDFYTHLGHLKGAVHGVNYKLAAPLAAIGLRRLTRLQTHLDRRRRNARRILDALPADGILHEFGYGEHDRPNYYNLVLTAGSHQQKVVQALSALGLPPDSARYGYRPLYQQPIFAEYATAWLRDRKLADRTRERNESVVRLHILPTFGSGSVADVTTARVRSWRGKLLAAGVGEPSVVKAYQLLRALMNTAVDDELIDQDFRGRSGAVICSHGCLRMIYANGLLL